VVGSDQFERAFLSSSPSRHDRHLRFGLFELRQTGPERGRHRSAGDAARGASIDGHRCVRQGDVHDPFVVVEHHVVGPHGDHRMAESHSGDLDCHPVASVHGLPRHVCQGLGATTLQFSEVFVGGRLLSPLLPGALPEGTGELVELIRHRFRAFWRTADVQRRFVNVEEERG